MPRGTLAGPRAVLSTSLRVPLPPAPGLVLALCPWACLEVPPVSRGRGRGGGERSPGEHRLTRAAEGGGAADKAAVEGGAHDDAPSPLPVDCVEVVELAGAPGEARARVLERRAELTPRHGSWVLLALSGTPPPPLPPAPPLPLGLPPLVLVVAARRGEQIRASVCMQLAGASIGVRPVAAAWIEELEGGGGGGTGGCALFSYSSPSSPQRRRGAEDAGVGRAAGAGEGPRLGMRTVSRPSVTTSSSSWGAVAAPLRGVKRRVSWPMRDVSASLRAVSSVDTPDRSSLTGVKGSAALPSLSEVRGLKSRSDVSKVYSLRVMVFRNTPFLGLNS